MSLILLLALQVPPASVPPADANSEILVTASRTPIEQGESAVSSTVIDERRIEAIGALQAVDLLRLSPGLSVSASGARGAQAQVRIRGAEANHSLIFIDGIQFNDPAGGNEPRFELLNADGLGRIEIVRGPQSALWGSEALGGVIALDSPLPAAGTRGAATLEYGSHDSLRASASGTFGSEKAGLSLSGGHIRSDGIDVLGGGTGDRDGFDNTSLSAKGVGRPGGDIEVGLVGRYIDHRSRFDGTDPVTFLRADTGDVSKTRTGALRAYVRIGADPAARWAVTLDAQYLTSANRNFNSAAPLNRTSGDRTRFSAQVEHRLDLGGSRHVLVAAAEREDEDFKARDQQFFGGTNQDRSRGRNALVGEWRARWGGRFSTDIAVRHDDYNRFADETTLRATAAFELARGLSLTGSYGEGVAQPTFFDLYGFFPGSFVGNPALTAETSRGWETGLRWKGAAASASVTGFESRLRNEIVGTFDSATFLSSTANATGTSRRRGFEIEGEMSPTVGLRLSANYTYLDAGDQQVGGGLRVREIRRPRHSANIAFDWESGALRLGGYVAYVGERSDVDFDLFPAPTVTLDDYALVSLRIGYRLTGAIEAFGRVENGFDADYRDVVGYNTPGRAVYAGLRFRFGD
ncbi:MAG TPA: TonB-dependent receptor [Allosphingosinicella sp.]|nr:TonB-dependent receptor [Allosphingosinicella sp.]